LSANPYLSGNEDDDLYESSSEESNNIREDLPQDLLHALSRYVNSGQVSAKVAEIPLACYAAAGMISFFGEIFSAKEDLPIISALCDVVNRISEGLLTKYLDLHQARHDIIIGHSIREYSNVVCEVAEGTNGDMEGAKLKTFIETYLSYINWRMDMSIKEYVQACKELEIEPDQNLISHGKIPMNDPFSRILYNPSASIADFKDIDSKRVQTTEYGDDYYNE